jgi:hypothetical protein
MRGFATDTLFALAILVPTFAAIGLWAAIVYAVCDSL